MSKKVRIPLVILFVLLFLASLCAVAYPYLSNYLAQQRQAEIVLEYDAAVVTVQDADVSAALEAARAYNAALANGQAEGIADYDALLDLTGNGIMGIITIPTLDIVLPVYHGTQSLELGALHLQGTSLPVGGSSTHCVISAHSGKQNEQYRDLATLLQSMAVGADAYLWNGRTNIDMDAQLVCIDTNRLLSLSQQTQASIYFNLLSLCWDVASRDRDEPVVILADEAHMLFDPRLPEVGLYIRNIAKRIRKYEGALWIATQSATDMLHESIRLAGQAIVDNSAYRLLFHTDAKNLEDTVDLFRLTPAEAKLLISFEQKNALCLIGTQHHIRTVFELPKYKLDLMGKGGGR